LLASLAVVGALAATAASASADIVINEVESDDPAVADFVEITNTGALPVDIGNYVVKDNDDGHAKLIPPVTMLAPNEYYVVETNTAPGAFGLGEADSVRLYGPGGAPLVDSSSWTWHAPATFGRCATGMTWTNRPTKGAANDCPGAAKPWLGSDAVSIADAPGVFGTNLSGLAYQPSGTSAPGVLWAVRNNPSTLFRLIWDGAKWAPDTTNGWSNGKQLRYPDGAGVPDAEGVTLAGGEIFVATERNDDGINSTTSRNSVLRYDVSGAGMTLTATREWNLTPALRVMPQNAGLEAITWIPDEVLVAKGFMDDVKGQTYNPADYPNHGTGLFFVGAELDGKIAAYALNQTTGTYDFVQSFPSGFPAVMDLTFDAETGKLWAVCDNGCDGRSATLDVAQTGPNAGYFLPTDAHARPAGMANLNNEGFAIAPQAECVNGLKPTFYADDSSTAGHALRMGKIACKAPAPAPSQPNTTPQQPGPGGAQADRTAPQLKAALKLAKTTRRNGKLTATITLNERANLTIKLTKGSKTLVKTSRKNTAAGKTTIKLTLKRSARATLRKGQKLTLTVQARDAAGNVAKRTATAKVR
jgi:hypothetical protein